MYKRQATDKILLHNAADFVLSGAMSLKLIKTETGKVVQYVDEKGSGAPAYIMLSDRKAQGTYGGTFTSGAWQTRTLNTENADAGGHCSLSSNEFTLAAGTYRIIASAPAYYVGLHKTRLYNVTDAAVQQDVGPNEMYGTAEYSRGTSGVDHASNRSFIVGRFTLASSKALRIEHRCSTTTANVGYGSATGLSLIHI